MSNDEKEQRRSKLWVWGADLDPEQVTRLLQIQPEWTARAGEPSMRVNRDGKAEPTGYLYRRGHWRAAIDKDKTGMAVDAQLEDWCRRLGERDTAVGTLQAQGCQMKIDFYISEGPVVLVELPATLLKELGDLNVALSFGIYDFTNIEFQTSPMATNEGEL